MFLSSAISQAKDLDEVQFKASRIYCNDEKYVFLEPPIISFDFGDNTDEAKEIFDTKTFNILYPRISTCQSINFRLKVVFDINHSGEIESAKIINSEPYRIMDKSILRALYKVMPFKEFYGTKNNKFMITVIAHKEKKS